MIEQLAQDPRVAWVEDVLRFGDTDKYGHINNSVFSVLCESGRVDLFRTLLYSTFPPGVFIVIARLAINFRAELHYPGRVRTGTWPTKLGRSSITVEQALFSDGQLAATAESVCVLVDRETRRPTPFPDATRRNVENVLRPPFSPGA